MSLKCLLVEIGSKANSKGLLVGCSTKIIWQAIPFGSVTPKAEAEDANFCLCSTSFFLAPGQSGRLGT